MSKRQRAQDLIDEWGTAVETLSNQIDCGWSQRDLAEAGKRLQEAKLRLSQFLDEEFGKT